MNVEDRYINFVDKYLSIVDFSEQQLSELLNTDDNFLIDPIILMSTFVARLIDKYISDKSKEVVEFWTIVLNSPQKQHFLRAETLRIVDYRNTRYNIFTYRKSN